MFSGKVLPIKRVSGGFPTSRGNLLSHQHFPSSPCSLTRDFVPWDGGVWGLTGTAEGQEGSSEEWEVQEVVLGCKPRGLGGNIVQIPPRDI